MQINNSVTSPGSLASEPNPALALRDGERWYVVHAQAQREACAQMQLGNQGYRTFLPRYEKTVRHARKVLQTLAPLFPRYLFIILDLERDRWHSVNGTIGVSGMIMSLDRPSAVPKGVVETLIALSSSDKKLLFQPDLLPGQQVRLVAGPFAEQLGVIQHFDDCGRVRVLLEMMGAWYPVSLSRADVLPVS